MLSLNLFFLIKKMIQISDFLSFKMLDKKFSLRRIARVSISTCKSFFENVLSLPTCRNKVNTCLFLYRIDFYKNDAFNFDASIGTWRNVEARTANGLFFKIVADISGVGISWKIGCSWKMEFRKEKKKKERKMSACVCIHERERQQRKREWKRERDNIKGVRVNE